MADKENISIFGIELGVKTSGENDVLGNFNTIIEQGKKVGATVDQITEAIAKYQAKLNEAISAQKKLLSDTLLKTRDPELRTRLGLALDNRNSQLEIINSATASAMKKAVRETLSPSKEKLGLEEILKKTALAWGQFYVAMKPVRIMYNWVEGVAQLNMQLRMLHYSSGMAIASLNSYGNVASLYGGSANSVAAYNERHQVQLARARRGLGMGHFQEAAWQFGFRFDANEDPNARFRRAIEHMRRLSPTDQLAFAKLEAPGREKELMAWAKRGVKSYDDFMKYMDAVANMRTVGGKNLFETVSKESEQLSESQKKLSAEFDAAKSEFAALFLPVLRNLTETLSSVIKWFNSLDPWVKRVALALGALVGAVYAAKGTFEVFKTVKGILGGLSAIGGGAGGVASGAGGGFSEGVGKTAGGLAKSAGGALAAGIGSGVISAVGTAGMGYLVYTIANDVLMPWFAAWKAVNMLHSYDPEHQKEIENSMKAGGIDEDEASHLLLAGLQKIQFRDQQFADHKALYKRIGEIVAVAQSGENAQTVRATSYIGGNVQTNNDNRQLTVNQTFVSSGNVKNDAEVAKSEMSRLDLYDSILNH